MSFGIAGLTLQYCLVFSQSSRPVSLLAEYGGQSKVRQYFLWLENDGGPELLRRRIQFAFFFQPRTQAKMRLCEVRLERNSSAQFVDGLG